MAKKDQDARERIIKAATEILNEVSDIDTITVRQIAERAGVGTGSINYHFNSKDNLLSLAVGDVLAKMATGFLTENNGSSEEPVQKLKAMLKELSSVAVANKKLIQFMLTQGVLNGDMHAPLYLIPVLKEIFGAEKEEIELRVIALQILHPLQVVGIAPAEFRMYSGIDLYDTQSRNKFIDMLIDNIIGTQRRKPNENSNDN